MPIRTSKTEHEYPYGHKRVAGEKFEVEAPHVEVLIGLGRIEPEPGDAVPDHARRDMHAGDSTTYSTRALTAASARASKRTNTRKAH